MIDIIIPIYNAFSQVSRCIESVLRETTADFRLILIDDGSEPALVEYLQEIAESAPNIILVENQENLGFVKTVNKGLEYELDSYREKFKIILNSDTIVTPRWLEKFTSCFDSAEDIGLACPVSNNAENLSISMPSGFNYLSLAQKVDDIPTTEYPDITTAVGFCMGIRADLLRDLGVFDEIFSPGYGEESDYHFRTLCRGFRSVLIPNCFVYHEGDASFSARKQEIISRNRPIFDDRWKQIYLNELSFSDKQMPMSAYENIVELRNKHDLVVFLPTAKLFGGIIVAFEIINRLVQRGIDATAIILDKNPATGIELLFEPYYILEEELPQKLPESKIYAATFHRTVAQTLLAKSKFPNSRLWYLVQGYEGWFPGSSLEEVALSYDSIETKICVSEWLNTLVKKQTKRDNIVIANGVDRYLFSPSDQATSEGTTQKKERLSLFTMTRDDPQNGWKLSLEVFKRIQQLDLPVDIIVMGDKAEDDKITPYVTEAYTHLSRKEVAKKLRQCDIFLDTSLVQGFGLMGLEAMACGVATILSKSGGVNDYSHGDANILVELCDVEEIVASIQELCNDRAKLYQLKVNGIKRAQDFCWNKVIDKYENLFKEAIAKQNAETVSPRALEYLSHRYLDSRQELIDAKQEFHEKLSSTQAHQIGTEQFVAKPGTIMYKLISNQ